VAENGRTLPYRFEVHFLQQECPLRVEVERIELVGDIWPAAAKASSGNGATKLPEASPCNAIPKPLQGGSCLFRAAFGQSRCQQYGVDGAGACSTCYVELEGVFLEKAVENAPCEGAEGSAALRRE
jgi:hypothetical protein